MAIYAHGGYDEFGNWYDANDCDDGYELATFFELVEAGCFDDYEDKEPEQGRG